MAQRRPAVFLDRDGVLNDTTVLNGTPYPPKTVSEVKIIDGVEQACAMLKSAGFLLIGATNQPDVARGTQTRENIEAINSFVVQKLHLDDMFTCWHDNADNCDCRKPRPGLILQGAGKYGVDLAASYMVGDRWSDVAAGEAAGCRTFLIDLPYSQGGKCDPDWRVGNLLEAAVKIVEIEKRSISLSKSDRKGTS